MNPGVGVTILLVAAVFEAEVTELPADLVEKMRGTTWHVGCPVPPEELRLVRLRHRGFDGEVHQGGLVVHRAVAEATVEAFEEIFELGYPIERMVPESEYGGDDDRSMAANNTSAFNCRPVTGRGRGFSAHSYGRAIDLNPLYNPYVKGQRVLPRAGKKWADRTRPHPSRIDADGAVVRAFESRGFRWGGRWRSLKDYQHFERPLRSYRPAEILNPPERACRPVLARRRSAALVGCICPICALLTERPPTDIHHSGGLTISAGRYSFRRAGCRRAASPR